MENTMEMAKERLEAYLSSTLANKKFSGHDFEFDVQNAVQALFPEEERKYIVARTSRDHRQSLYIVYVSRKLKNRRANEIGLFRVDMKKVVANKGASVGFERYAYKSFAITFIYGAKTLSEAFRIAKEEEAEMLEEQFAKEDEYVELFKLIKESGMASNFGQLSALLVGASDCLNDYDFRSGEKFQGVYPE